MLTTPAHALDYFGRPSGPTATASAPVVTTPSSWALPAPVQHTLAAVIRWQSELNAQLRIQTRAARDGHTLAALQGIVLLSFLYGVLHAIGPGHGKLVISGYFLTQRARITQGLIMSAWAAFVQALVAIILVGALAVVFRVSASSILTHAASLEIASYAAITLLGAVMLRRLSKGLDTCGHDHSKDQPNSSTALRPPRAKASKPSKPRQASMQPAYRLAGSAPDQRWQTMFWTGAAIGLRPCSGAILVLLFCLANGIFAVGVTATFAMGAGVAITVSAVSLGALGAQRLLAGNARAQKWRRGVSWAGATLITLFGLLQIGLLASGAVLPSAG